MHKQIHFIAKAAAGLLAISLLASCGSSIEARNAISASGSSSSASGGAECNSFVAQGVGLAGGATTYYVNNVQQQTAVRLRITSVDANFDSMSEYVQFYRWKADSTGATTLDQAPLTFYVLRASDGATISGAMTSLSTSSMSSIRTNGGIGGSTAQDFFASTVLVLTNVDYSWNAAKVVVYKGTTAQAQADVLLPVFPANPNTYATNHPAVLSSLHPFWTIRTSAMSDADWATRDRAFCF
jgi:hypothetical protein